MPASAWPTNYIKESGTQFHSCDDTTNWILSTTGASTGSTYSIDTTDRKEGTGCVMIITPVGNAGTTYGQIRTNNLSVSTKGRLGFWFYVEDYSTLNKLSIFFSQDTSFTNYFLKEINFTTEGSTNQVKFNGWRWIEIAPTGAGAEFNWDPGAGSPTFPNAYTNVQIRFNAATNKVAVCKIDNFVVDAMQRTKLLITSDDAIPSWHTLGIPELDSRGLLHTWSIIASAIGGAGEVTLAQLQTVYNNGHDLCPHGEFNLSTLTSTQVLEDMKFNIDFLKTNGFTRTLNFYVWPNGVWEASAGSNDILNTARSLGIVAGRTAIPHLAAKAPFGWDKRIMVLPVIGWAATDTVADILSRIDAQVKNGVGAVILMFHGVVASGAANSEINTADLQALLDGVVSREKAGMLDVITASQFISGLTQPAYQGVS